MGERVLMVSGEAFPVPLKSGFTLNIKLLHAHRHHHHQQRMVALLLLLLESPFYQWQNLVANTDLCARSMCQICVSDLGQPRYQCQFYDVLYFSFHRPDGDAAKGAYRYYRVLLGGC